MIQNINRGAFAGDPAAENIYDAFGKVNANNNEYNVLIAGLTTNTVVFLIDNYELPDSATFSGQLTLVNNTNAAYVISTIPADKLNGEDNQAIYTGESFQIVKESTNNYSII